MNNSIERIVLDVQRINELISVTLKQGDTARSIEISLADGGFPYHIAEGCYAVFTCVKPDGNTLFNNCRVENDTIIYDVTKQTTAAAGKMIAEIKVYGPDDNVLTSANFRIFVNGTVYRDEEAESTPEFSALSHLISETIAALQDTGEATDNANAAAEEAKEAAKNAREAAGMVINRAEEAVRAAEAAAQSASSSASAADLAKTAAEAERRAAETAKTGAETAKAGAVTAKTAAEASARAASTSEGSARGYADQAATEAGKAAASASEAKEVAASVTAAALAQQQRVNTTQNYRLDNLEAAAQGYLYREAVDETEAYEKTVPADAMKWATLDQIGGKTLTWNQIMENGDFQTADGWQRYGTSLTVDNNVATVTGPSGFGGLRRIVKVIAGHRYFASVMAKFDRTDIPFFYPMYTNGAIPEPPSDYPKNTDWNLYTILKEAKSEELSIGVRFARGVDIDFTTLVKNFMLFDLTAMFGAGNEPSTPEEFRAMFPADYYPYCEPTLMNFSNAAVVSSTGHRLDTSAIVHKYFPDGMKSAGTVHDEIDWERMVAIQRVGSVDETGSAYAALAAPIETPITEAFDPSIEVGSGGSLTFENDQGENYHVPVPNQETFMIKLPGGTV